MITNQEFQNALSWAAFEQSLQRQLCNRLSSHKPPSKCQYIPKTGGNFNIIKAREAPDGLKSQSKRVFDINIGRTHSESQYVKQSSSELQLLFRNTIKQGNYANNFELNRAFKEWHRIYAQNSDYDLNQPRLDILGFLFSHPTALPSTV